VAPMSLITYQNVRPWARAIKNKVVGHEMPPGRSPRAQAGQRCSLSRRIDTIVRWADSAQGRPDCRPSRCLLAAGRSGSRTR
jgi:hypothetical protein